jgi:PPE-repeat protein
MSFSLYPPELNSALMYAGVGSGPLLEAASAWDGLAADLEATATQYQTVVTNLTTGPWLGGAAARMAAATQPFVDWLQGTAASAGQTGAQAKLAAAAYHAAYASMVPPEQIAVNRATLAELVSNNFLGQNTGAIATTEAQYLEMWVQDALTMDTYQAHSTAATTTLPQQAAAPQVASGALAHAAAAAQPADSATTSADIIQVLEDLATIFGVNPTTPLQSLTFTGLSPWLTSVGTSLVSAISADPSAALLPVQATYYMGMLGSMPARMFMSGGSTGAAGTASSSLAGSSDAILANVGKFVDGKLATVMSGVGGQLHTWGSSISAQLAAAHKLGGLAVPNAWHGMPGPEMTRAAPLLPATSVAAPSMSTGLPSSPFAQGLMGALAGRGMTSLGSRVSAKVMPRSPAGG